MAENNISDGLNIDKLSIDIDVSSKDAENNTKSFKETVDSLDESLKKTQKTTKKVDDFYQRWARSIQKTAKLISSTNKIGGKSTSVYEKSIKGMQVRYKIVNGQLDSIATKQEKQAKSTKKLDNIFSSVKHVIKYRAISAAISLISKGLTEGIKNAAMFDDKFNDMMSNFKAKTKEAVNSLGSIAASFITTFEPIITFLLDGASNVLDYFNQIMAAISGESYYRKAVQNVEDFANGVRKAYAGIGIDELNVFGEKDQANYKMVEISEAIKGQAKAWEALGKTILAVSAAIIAYNAVVSAVASAQVLVTLFATPIGQALLVIAAISAIGFAIEAFEEKIVSFFDNIEKKISNSFVKTQEKIGQFGVLFSNWKRYFESLELMVISFFEYYKIGFEMIASIFRWDWEGYFEGLKNRWKLIGETFLNILINPIYAVIDVLNYIIDKSNQLFGTDIKQIPTDWFSKSNSGYDYATSNYSSGNVNAGLSGIVANGDGSSFVGPTSPEIDYSGYFEVMINNLQNISNKNTNIILADDQVGRSNDRYLNSRGMVLNGGNFANAY